VFIVGFVKQKADPWDGCGPISARMAAMGRACGRACRGGRTTGRRARRTVPAAEPPYLKERPARSHEPAIPQIRGTRAKAVPSF
jgi:hypothetical protein